MNGDDNPAADVLDIVWTAVALQPEAEAVIVECLRRGPKGYVLGRRGHAVTSGYFDLREQLRRRRDSPGHRRLEQLLKLHQQIVEQALLLAYRPDSAIRDPTGGEHVRRPRRPRRRAARPARGPAHPRKRLAGVAD